MKKIINKDYLMNRILILLFFAVYPAWSMAVQKFSSDEPVGVPPVKIIYFIPSDMEPIPDREERLGRVMRCVQDFFRKGMEQNGYGSKTFALEWNTPVKLKLYEVRGKKKQDEYGRNDAFIVRNEVRDVLWSKYGIDADREVLVIFQLLLKKDGDKSIELGPYVGSGSSLSGTAWVYDDDRLDSDLLPSKEPGGYYNGYCSLGQFNTHYIGGVAHEMGHAFSLPHVCEWNSQRSEMGRALMGSGNHTFGKELRNEGPGAFLSESSALRLSVIRAFAGSLPGAGEKVDWIIEELSAVEEHSQTEKRTINLSGLIKASPKLLGVIAYNDNLNIPADYDAKVWMSRDIEDGRFRIVIDELQTAPYQLRLVGVHENGATSQFSVDYNVFADRIELEPINAIVPVERLRRLFRNKDVEEIKATTERSDEDETIRRMANHLLKLSTEKNFVTVADLPANVHTADLTHAAFTVEKTGWMGVHRGMVPGEELFIQIGGQFFESGLYAHAPSIYTVNLGGVWKTLSGGFGIQDGHYGAIRFIVRGDGKELFRSPEIKKPGKQDQLSVSVVNVRELELIVESTVQGNSGAWGIWINPQIQR
jgi:hypothetical protein